MKDPYFCPKCGISGHWEEDCPILLRRTQDLENILSKIVDTYVANRGTKHEFICCITPKPSVDLTPEQRKEDSIWSMFDQARKLLGEEL